MRDRLVDNAQAEAALWRESMMAAIDSESRMIHLFGEIRKLDEREEQDEEELDDPREFVGQSVSAKRRERRRKQKDMGYNA